MRTTLHKWTAAFGLTLVVGCTPDLLKAVLTTPLTKGNPTPSATASRLPVSAPTPASASATHERLFLGTGEYDPAATWHAILRFDTSETIDSVTSGVATTPDGTLDITTVSPDGTNPLNFVHSLYLDEPNDRLFAASLFTEYDGTPCTDYETDADPTTSRSLCRGAITVFNNASTLDAGATAARHIAGAATKLFQPHGVWVDQSRNILYVANTMDESILAWDDAGAAGAATSDDDPDRVITWSEMGRPVYVYVDQASDRMFVACMPGTTWTEPSILIYNNASTLNGSATPDLRIYGPGTAVDAPNNPTTHNVWYNPTTQELFMAHHTHQITIYDLSGISWTPASTPDDLGTSVPFRQIIINDSPSDERDWSAYGLFYLPSQDRLYVAAGYTPGGTTAHSGSPRPGSPENAVKIYDGISDKSKSGHLTPDREIHWSNGVTYYPGQPLWVQEY